MQHPSKNFFVRVTKCLIVLLLILETFLLRWF